MAFDVIDDSKEMKKPVNYEYLLSVIKWWFSSDSEMMDYLESIDRDLAGILLKDKIRSHLKANNMSKKKLCKKIKGEQGSIWSSIHSYLYDKKIKKESCIYINEICESLGINKTVTNFDFFIQCNNYKWNKWKGKKRKLPEGEKSRRKNYEERFKLIVENKGNIINQKVSDSLVEFVKETFGHTDFKLGVAEKDELTMDILRQFEEECPQISHIVEVIMNRRTFNIEKYYCYPFVERIQNQKYALVVRFGE